MTGATRRRALVTGGSGDIGGAICRALAVCGHHVYVHAHANAQRAGEVARDIAANKEAILEEALGRLRASREL